MAATQLPATRTTILVQGRLRETMNAETIATITNSVAMMPISPISQGDTVQSAMNEAHRDDNGRKRLGGRARRWLRR